MKVSYKMMDKNNQSILKIFYKLEISFDMIKNDNNESFYLEIF
jgi:hypothetical protein